MPSGEPPKRREDWLLKLLLRNSLPVILNIGKQLQGSVKVVSVKVWLILKSRQLRQIFVNVCDHRFAGHRFWSVGNSLLIKSAFDRQERTQLAHREQDPAGRVQEKVPARETQRSKPRNFVFLSNVTSYLCTKLS